MAHLFLGLQSCIPWSRMNHHRQEGNGRRLDPSPVSLSAPHLTHSFHRLCTPFPAKPHPCMLACPLRQPVPVPTSSALDFGLRLPPSMPDPVSQGQSHHRDARVGAKGGIGGGGKGARGGLDLMDSKVGWDRDFPATHKPPESDRSWTSRQAWGGAAGAVRQDDSHLPKPHRLPPRISVNIGTLFRASTEGSVALRLKNKN